MATFFPNEYEHARDEFCHAARASSAEMLHFAHPRDPDLSCDVAVVHGRTKRAVVTVSGTHGIEGYCGSAIQTALLRRQSEAVSQVHIHGLNCWGMKYFSRTNEDHIDVNRNFIADPRMIPVNAGYAGIHPHIAFDDWCSENLKQFWSFHETFVRQHGVSAWNRAFSGGQYLFSDGVMFGGTSACWSHQTLLQVFRELPEIISPALVLDIHTGVGPFGEPTLLVHERSGGQDAGTPLSTRNFSGLLVADGLSALPEDCRGIVVEYGTFPPGQMMEAILYDRWTRQHLSEGLNHRRALLDLYCPREDEWRTRVLSHACLLWDSLSHV